MNNMRKAETAELLEAGDMKEIKTIPGMQKIAPNISWGEEFEKQPIEWRVGRAKRVASAMNHAADILQQERNKLIEVGKAQEQKIIQLTHQYAAQGDLMHKQLQVENAKQQKLNTQLVEQMQEIKELKRLLKATCGG